MKTFVCRLIGTLNLLVIVGLVVTGYSGLVDPREHPLIAASGLAFPLFLTSNLLFLVIWVFIRFRMILLPIAGFVLAAWPVGRYLPLSSSEEAPEEALKVMSFNVWTFGLMSENSQETEKQIIDYILNSKADIVCLQEAGLNEERRERFSAVYPYIGEEFDGKDAYSVILSKYPISRSCKIPYKAKGANISAAFWVKVGQKDVLVVNNHFEITGLSNDQRSEIKNIIHGVNDDGAIRREARGILECIKESSSIRAPQVDAVRTFLSKHRDETIFLCGDFNDSPLSYANYRLSSLLRDCYVSTGNGPGFTYHQNGIRVRIDNIMCSHDVTPYGCKVDSDFGFSDHYPVLCSLKIKGLGKK